MRDERFDNLATLFTQATAQLCQIVETPYTIYFDQALNCVRVLTRVLPFLLEKGDLGDGDLNVEALCWGDHVDGNTTVASKKNRRNDDDDKNDDDEEDDDEDDSQEPLALLVVHAAMHMLFLPQFTCEFYEEDDEDD